MKFDWDDVIDALLLVIGVISIFVPIIMMALYEASPMWMLGWLFSAVTPSLVYRRKK